MHFTTLNYINLNYINYTAHTTLRSRHCPLLHYITITFDLQPRLLTRSTQINTTLMTLHHTTLHHTTPEYTTVHHPQLQLQPQLRYFILHYIGLLCITPQHTTLHNIPLQCYSTCHYRHCTTTGATATSLRPLQIHYATATTAAALHYTTSSSCG